MSAEVEFSEHQVFVTVDPDVPDPSTPVLMTMLAVVASRGSFYGSVVLPLDASDQLRELARVEAEKHLLRVEGAA